jgi:hypothetical protein
MSTRNTGGAMSGTMLSPAELAVRLDEGLVALMAASCPHGRAEHVSPSPDVQYPVGDWARDGAAGHHHPDHAEPGGTRVAAQRITDDFPARAALTRFPGCR